MSGELKRCESLSDLLEFSGERGLVVGRYVQVDVRQRQTGPPQYIGYAGVQFEDQTIVMLEPTWSPAGLRPYDERTRFDGRKVAVTGTVYVEMPEPEQAIAYLVAPCISPVEMIRLLHGD